MYNYNGIIQFKNYGNVVVKFSEVMDKHNITRNKFSKLTGIKYGVVDRYYKAKNMGMVDLDFLAKACFVLKCDICEILEYDCDNKNDL